MTGPDAQDKPACSGGGLRNFALPGHGSRFAVAADGAMRVI